jgi:hypothetical protein
MDKRVQGFETQLYICSVVRNKAGIERARNFFGITHLRDLTAVRDVGLGAKKGGELGGGTDAGVMSGHNPPKKYVQRTGWRIKQAIDASKEKVRRIPETGRLLAIPHAIAHRVVSDRLHFRGRWRIWQIDNTGPCH